VKKLRRSDINVNVITDTSLFLTNHEPNCPNCHLKKNVKIGGIDDCRLVIVKGVDLA
jgi:hypothetical protein